MAQLPTWHLKNFTVIFNVFGPCVLYLKNIRFALSFTPYQKQFYSPFIESNLTTVKLNLSHAFYYPWCYFVSAYTVDFLIRGIPLIHSQKYRPILFWLKRQLKKSHLASRRLILFYITCICSMLEDGSPVLHRAWAKLSKGRPRKTAKTRSKIIFPELSYWC